MTQIRQLDNRKRIALAGIALHDIYQVQVEPSGRIILHPAVVVPTDLPGVDQWLRKVTTGVPEGP